MNGALVLHQNLSESDKIVASVAGCRGWNVVSLGADDLIPVAPMIRYYGNTSCRTFSRRHLPITYHEIDLGILGSLFGITHRPVSLLKLLELEQPLVGSLFVKPAQGKWFKSRVYGRGEVIEASPKQMESEDPRDRLIYVAPPTWFDVEVRCWCLDGKVITSSPYRGNSSSIELGLITDLVSSICASAAIPRSIVMDFGKMYDGKWALIEFNKPWAAGIYRADPDKCFECIVASQTDLTPSPKSSKMFP